MSKKRKQFTNQQRDRAVEEYTSGKKTATELAKELGTDVGNIYRWKTVRTERAKGARIDELVSQGNSQEVATRLLNMELELEEYKKKLAEQVVLVELLKKLQTSTPSAGENELIGLIKTTKKSAAKKRRVEQ